ncbi:antitoxin Xre/MbcA/ParS toxin-binding domain-containing protein [Nannocystis sp. SCPEA4]|uniref:antitoxin Xre/MbcA/ParS toxin-binding domain-containing protein n=1 Tax=Nannocystis sp. SCPEA4 TaxID=2996787 RepID=UPI00226F5E10|nr:antitoxin Xre/MbcA/ParS toxin-binding domain-containing protein [Nannocystis sp. SCPEA4]MCY1056208.1 DUF2384 domain-containing protein [Nannocystis sp. SCPEA4]
MMENLEDHYAGDAAWNAFAPLFRGQLADYASAEQLKQLLGGDEELADVVYGSVGDSALQWVIQPIPALSGLSPVQCLASDKTRNRLREMLLRMPR